MDYCVIHSFCGGFSVVKKLVPPCAYQGGKQRLSSQILDIIEQREQDFVLYDLCCGSGAVSLEAVNRGYNVVMIDKGPYGAVWDKISKGEFDLNIFEEEIKKLPKIEEVQGYLKDLSIKPVDKDLFVYHYLLLQSGAFGSKQIWVENDKWCNNTFRNYWLPTENSNRRSPVNPMMPMANTLYSRILDILTYGQEKIIGYNIDIFDSIELINKDTRKKVIYIDPPYKNTTGYLGNFDIFEVIKLLSDENLYISEGFVFDISNCESIVLSEGRKKGNVSGTVKKDAVKEVLNIIKGGI